MTENHKSHTASGTHIAKWQWDLIHDPGVRVRIFERDGDAMIINYGKPVTITWKPVNPPQLIKNKKELKYVAQALYEEQGKESTAFFKMADGSTVARFQDPKHKYEESLKYEIQFEGDKTWYELDVQTLTENCLSCDLTRIVTDIEKTVARILPVEDMYILISGEDFDGKDASRIAAGGFIILEAVQAGKVFKLIKGARIFSRTAGTVSATRRVLWTAGKEITKDALIDMSIQFFINFISLSIQKEYEYTDGLEIAEMAFNSINLKEALWQGLIAYTSLSSTEQTIFDCAYKLLKRSNEEKNEITNTLIKSGIECVFLLGSRIALKHISKSNAIHQLIRELTDKTKYDLLTHKLVQFGIENANSFMESLIDNSVQEIIDKN